jgi:hypothetical protein
MKPVGERRDWQVAVIRKDGGASRAARKAEINRVLRAAKRGGKGREKRQQDKDADDEQELPRARAGMRRSLETDRESSGGRVSPSPSSGNCAGVSRP